MTRQAVPAGPAPGAGRVRFAGRPELNKAEVPGSDLQTLFSVFSSFFPFMQVCLTDNRSGRRDLTRREVAAGNPDTESESRASESGLSRLQWPCRRRQPGSPSLALTTVLVRRVGLAQSLRSPCFAEFAQF